MLINPFPEIKCIHPIVIELPGFGDLKTSNVYALGSGPITLVDTAPKFPGSFEEMRKQLKKAGFDFPDVNRIIITHGHIDHFGLAAQITKAAGHSVECYIHEEDIWRISSSFMKGGMWSEDAQRFVDLVGMPPKDIERMRRRSAFFIHFCDPLDEVRAMHEGDEFSGDGYHLTVVHTPGHTPGSCCLYESHNRVLFSGDHIIKHITPNPFIEVHRSRLRDPGYQSLRAYNNSLAKVEQLDIDYVYSGHGGYIEELPALISGYRKHHNSRKDLIWKALKEHPRPVYNLVPDIFQSVPDSEVFLAVSEIFVHLEILMDEGRAELADPGPPAIYRAV